ncbi:Uncharacterized protein ESCO_000173 [Escovopsis weberi]|uniref:Uncharacterized protein n=1 Tax=Escovopsis weberi TaxID=150374 RepID=A0A0M8MSU1_ESCWE|nr:Uncharacterized protein ESCO_000173 [Escovopsis weberi]
MANVFSITPRAPDWNAQTTETLEDPDEPPEKLPPSAFTRSTIRHPAEQPSLLTRAILAQSDEENSGRFTAAFHTHRRRSMTSNFSIASTADLTSDTGYTSPSRVGTPSPPTHTISILQLHSNIADNNNNNNNNSNSSGNKPGLFNGRAIAFGAQPAANGATRKRCIQFACGAKPAPPPRHVTDTPPASRPVSAQEMQEPPRRTSIKFACQARPTDVQSILSRPSTQGSLFSDAVEPRMTTSPQKVPVLATTPTAVRPPLTRKPSNKATTTRPRFLRATSGDLTKDGSQFHEFASDMAREDDWIRNDNLDMQTKLTISDTLRKENSIRRLATEVEEEEAAQLEEEEADRAPGCGDDDDDNNDDDDEEDGGDKDDNDDDDEDLEFDDDDHDDLDDYDAELEDEDSDGYHTDEETGFADSDDEDDGNENMVMWTPGHYNAGKQSSVGFTRRLSANEHHSDSSANSRRSGVRRAKARPIGPTADAADLPDSTDFVCGTLDEDKPLEEVFISCLAARRTENLRVIPQDIDPSFPASDLDEEDEDDSFNAVQQGSDPNVWPMDDVHHDQDRSRRQKGDRTPPRRFRSPPPAKRHQSPPPPRTRGRSPKLLFDCHSPRRVRSPAPRALVTPLQTPRQGAHVHFNLAGRPGLTQTKSLPKPAALFRYSKQHKSLKITSDDETHMRGAIDIVKGLEKKRQRRKEKFMQKYCDRARRGQIPERKALPGLGAERMKEVGLIMAGKKDPGNYVLSF